MARDEVQGSAVTVLRDCDPFPAGLPLIVQVEFTSRCNLRCRMCPLTTGTSSSSAAPGPMTDVVFDEVLQIARRCRQVLLAGYGEPLTNPQCIPMMRALEAEKITMGMATNGIAVTRDVARTLVELEHLTLINVSIDSPDPDVYREVRGGSVHRALRGLRNLMAVIDDPGRVMVSSVALCATLPSLVAFPALLAELGVRRYSLQAVVDYNDYSRQESLLDRVDMAEHLREIEAACAAYGIDLELSGPDRSRAELRDANSARERFYGFGEWDERFTRQCHVPWEVPFIDKDGRVFACCFAAASNERQLGQVGPQTFDDVWTGVEFRRFRRDIVDGRSTPDICRRCTVAPLGDHLFQTWAASVVSGFVTHSAAARATVSISIRNDGARSWTAADRVRVGTAAPRDSRSPFEHRAWLKPDRPATFLEATVPPGGIATFEFPVMTRRGVRTSEFELVAEDQCWIPNTRFEITVRGRRHLVSLRPLLIGLRQRQGLVARTCKRAVPRSVHRHLAKLAR
jgi:radical SAM protein with 4Fe4S-binding SPASM domain